MKFKLGPNISCSEEGFTLIEMMLVVALLGITSAMFATTFSITVNRSSEVSDQNILQTEVRGSLNTLVEDLRSATREDSTTPIIDKTNSSVTFYSPGRTTLNGLRRVVYWWDGAALKRRVTLVTSYVTSYDGNDSPVDPGDTGPVETIVPEVAAPVIPAQGDAPNSGWAAGQIFKYCGQNPNDMAPLEESEAPDPITWTCTAPTNLANIKTIIVRVTVSANPRSKRYTYGAAATMRWNAS